MALTTKGVQGGEGGKLKNIEDFTAEFNPVLDQVNFILNKYGLNKDIILLGWDDGKITPFIHYQLFPSSSLKSKGLDL